MIGKEGKTEGISSHAFPHAARSQAYVVQYIKKSTMKMFLFPNYHENQMRAVLLIMGQ